MVSLQSRAKRMLQVNKYQQSESGSLQSNVMRAVAVIGNLSVNSVLCDLFTRV